MTNAIFLAAEQIIELTGKKRRDRQKQALREMGIEHKVRPDGSLAVLLSHIEKEFDGYNKGAMVETRAEPNWDAMRVH